MPGWHAAAKKWVAEGKLKILGIIQEQHPERCKLFAQWKEFDWPILHDPINLLENRAVPIAIAIDEHGIVRSLRPNPRTLEAEFLDVKFPKPSKQDEAPKNLGIDQDWKTMIGKVNPDTKDVAKLRQAGDSLILWSDSEHLSRAIGFYAQGIDSGEAEPSLLYRLGVAHLMRHESEYRKPDDFAKAVGYWSRALAANPNQYIWRRRIQQYGPRLDKPYPFYDWVSQAREEIRSRGGQPIKLPVEPTGAELASRARNLKTSEAQTNPDPEARINKDLDSLVKLETAVVPHTSDGKKSAMIHILFQPGQGVKWSNDAGPLVVWVEGKEIRQSRKLFSVTNRNRSESDEPRKVELEITKSPTATELTGFALYYVCKNSGECRYVRQDFKILLK